MGRYCMRCGCAGQLLGGMERDGAKFHHVTQDGAQFKPDQLFISGKFYFKFLG